MIRLLWWALLAIVAGVAVVAEIDRASARKPQLAFFVPGPFRGFAQPTITMMALATGQAKTGQVEARKLVERRPMPAENVYALALADLSAGDTAGFARDFEVATSRGWRVVPLQIAAAEAALGRRDVKAAAPRIAAVRAVDGKNAKLPDLVARLEALPGGKAAMASISARMRAQAP